MTEIDAIQAVTREQIASLPKAPDELVFLHIGNPAMGYFRGKVPAKKVKRLTKFIMKDDGGGGR